MQRATVAKTSSAGGPWEREIITLMYPYTDILILFDCNQPYVMYFSTIRFPYRGFMSYDVEADGFQWQPPTGERFVCQAWCIATTPGKGAFAYNGVATFWLLFPFTHSTFFTYHFACLFTLLHTLSCESFHSFFTRVLIPPFILGFCRGQCRTLI